MEKPKRARRRKPETAKADLKPILAVPGGQGVHREVESEGHAEVPGRNRWGLPRRWTGRPKVGQGRACSMKAKAFSFTHRTKVFADGTVRKDSV
jgi:hypothetical protein